MNLRSFLLFAVMFVSFQGICQDNSVNEQFILDETIGGALDFNKKLENESGGLYIFNYVAYNKKNYAILLWAMALKRLKVRKSKQAIKLFEIIHSRKMTKPEKNAIKHGFRFDPDNID